MNVTFEPKILGDLRIHDLRIGQWFRWGDALCYKLGVGRVLVIGKGGTENTREESGSLLDVVRNIQLVSQVDISIRAKTL